jgi:hypothetical protein
LCLAANFEPAGGPASEERIEAVVVHVDEYAVYAPNLVFYFDSQMDKKRLEALKRTADRLRNRKALIIYSQTVDSNNGKRMLLTDIVSAAERYDSERVSREAAVPPGELQYKPVLGLSDETASPAQHVQPDSATGAHEVRTQAVRSGPAPITREEAVAFIRDVLYVNGKKDLSAVASFYADKVDYYDRGVISRDKVLQDLKYYFRNWSQIDTRMDGDIAMAGLEPEVRIVKFICSFSVKNDIKSIAGKSENVWTIQRINGELKLIDVKQKILKD